MDSRGPLLEAEVAQLYREHSPSLTRYAASLTSNPEEVRDAVQEVFLRYFTERRYGRQILNPSAWLFQVLRNHLFRNFRRARGSEELDADTLRDTHASPERLVAGRQLARKIAATLTARERDCLRLRGDGMGYLEIAETLRIRPGTVGALLNRVHQKLSGERVPLAESADALMCILWEDPLHSS